jgi:hypothetical protein
MIKTLTSLETIKKITYEEIEKKIAEEDDLTKFYILVITRELKKVLERQEKARDYREILEIDFWIALLTSALETWSEELEKED